MIELIKKEIGKRLKEVFGESEVYDEEMTQNGQLNSFSIKLKSLSYEKKINFYNCICGYEVVYYPAQKTRHTRTILGEVGLELVRSLDEIYVKGHGIRMTDREVRIEENHLSYTFAVAFFEREMEETVKMEKKKIEIKGEI